MLSLIRMIMMIMVGALMLVGTMLTGCGGPDGALRRVPMSVCEPALRDAN